MWVPLLDTGDSDGFGPSYGEVDVVLLQQDTDNPAVLAQAYMADGVVLGCVRLQPLPPITAPFRSSYASRKVEIRFTNSRKHDIYIK